MDLTSFEEDYSRYNKLNFKTKIIHEDYIYTYFLLNPLISFSSNAFTTEAGPIVGMVISPFPNFDLLYPSTSDLIYSARHRGSAKDLTSFTYGIRVSERFMITKNLFVSLDMSLKFSNSRYSFSLRAVGLDSLPAYHDTLAEKVLNIGIRTGIYF